MRQHEIEGLIADVRLALDEKALDKLEEATEAAMAGGIFSIEEIATALEAVRDRMAVERDRALRGYRKYLEGQGR